MHIRSRTPLPIESGPIYWSFAVLNICLGIALMLAPDDWYGPSWSYFYTHGQAIVPAGGFGMGLCCCGIGGAQLVALTLRNDLVLSVLFFLGGFVFWTAGIILGAEGLLGHQGLMEAPFMLVLGGHKLALSAALRVYSRQGRA